MTFISKFNINNSNNNLIAYTPNLSTEAELQEKNVLYRNSIYYVVNSRQDLKTTTAFLKMHSLTRVTNVIDITVVDNVRKFSTNSQQNNNSSWAEKFYQIWQERKNRSMREKDKNSLIMAGLGLFSIASCILVSNNFEIITKPQFVLFGYEFFALPEILAKIGFGLIFIPNIISIALIFADIWFLPKLGKLIGLFTNAGFVGVFGNEFFKVKDIILDNSLFTLRRIWSNDELRDYVLQSFYYGKTKSNPKIPKEFPLDLLDKLIIDSNNSILKLQSKIINFIAEQEKIFDLNQRLLEEESARKLTSITDKLVEATMAVKATPGFWANTADWFGRNTMPILTVLFYIGLVTAGVGAILVLFKQTGLWALLGLGVNAEAEALIQENAENIRRQAGILNQQQQQLNATNSALQRTLDHSQTNTEQLAAVDTNIRTYLNETAQSSNTNFDILNRRQMRSEDISNYNDIRTALDIQQLQKTVSIPQDKSAGNLWSRSAEGRTLLERIQTNVPQPSSLTPASSTTNTGPIIDQQIISVPRLSDNTSLRNKSFKDNFLEGYNKRTTSSSNNSTSTTYNSGSLPQVSNNTLTNNTPPTDSSLPPNTFPSTLETFDNLNWYEIFHLNDHKAIILLLLCFCIWTLNYFLWKDVLVIKYNRMKKLLLESKKLFVYSMFTITQTMESYSSSTSSNSSSSSSSSSSSTSDSPLPNNLLLNNETTLPIILQQGTLPFEVSFDTGFEIGSIARGIASAETPDLPFTAREQLIPANLPPTTFLDADIQRRTTVAAQDAQFYLNQSNDVAPSTEQIQKMKENAEKAEERARKFAAWSKAGMLAAIGIGIFAGWKSKDYYDKINNSSSTSSTSSSSQLITSRVTSASDDVLATWKGPISGKIHTLSREK